MSKGLLIFNPKAGQSDPDLLPAVKAGLGEVEVLSWDALGEIGNTADRARTLGCQWVAGMGGDGTVEALAAALVGTDLPLGIIPAGTFNNFARSLGIPPDPVDACATIRARSARSVDMGLVNGSPFFECVGTGLDAELYPVGEDIKSGKPSRWADFFARAFRYRPQPYSLSFDCPACEALHPGNSTESRRLVRRLSRHTEHTVSLRALMIIVSNGPYFGMNFAVAPGQRMDDGKLTVSIFSRYNKLQLWWHFFTLALRPHPPNPRSISFRVESLKISSPNPQAVHLDGQPRPDLWPLDIACQPAAIQVFRPE